MQRETQLMVKQEREQAMNKPIYKMSTGVDDYRAVAKRYGYTFDGDDQLANINAGLTEIIEENLELKSRVRGLRHQRDEMSSKTEDVE